MKKIFLLPILALFMLVGCSDLDQPSNGVSNKWVRFDLAEYKSPENGGAYRIPVLLSSNTNPDGVTVNFTVASEHPGFTYSPASGTVTIPAGEFVGYIDVTPSYDPANEIEESYPINLTLTGSQVGLGLAGQGINNVSTVLTVTKKACPLNLEDFYGSYLGTQLDDPSAVTYAVTIEKRGDGSSNVVTIKNIFDVAGSNKLILDNSNPADPQAVFEDGEFLFNSSGNGVINIFNPAHVGSSLISSFNTCTQELTLYFAAGRDNLGFFTGFITTDEDSPDFLIQKVVLTKQ